MSSSGFMFSGYLKKYVMVTDKQGSNIAGFFLDGDYNRIILEPFVVDVSENSSKPDYQLTGKFTMPFENVRSIAYTTIARIRNVIIPGINRIYGVGSPNSLYFVSNDKDSQFVDGDGI